MGNGRIFIGYCHGGGLDQCMVDSMTRAKAYDNQQRKILAAEGNAGGLYITINRNKVTEQFLDSDCEYFWSLDTDMQFQPDTAYRLVDTFETLRALRGPQIGVVSAIYFGYIGETASMMQPIPIWFHEHPNGMPYVVQSITGGQLVELKNIGFGCCLIHRDVFEKMDEVYGVIEKDGVLYRNDFTWFDHDMIFDYEEIEYRGHKFRKLLHAGEDITFCQRARKCGFEIWGNPNIETNHLKKRFENYATFLKGGMVTTSKEGVA